MSSFPFYLIPDHDADLPSYVGQVEENDPDASGPISAESVAQNVRATKAVLRDKRVVFEDDVPLFVYRSYPISVSVRPGSSTAPHLTRLSLRAILVEPLDLQRSDEFKDCSVVYAIWPSEAAWWERAPFRLRHPDNILKYDSLETSLLNFPSGCDICLAGSVRPLHGYLRSSLTDKRAVGQQGERVQIRSALLLDPLRLAHTATTGRRASHRDPDPGDSPEEWHWGLVKDFDACLAALLEDPVIVEFSDRVKQENFLIEWFKPQREISAQIRGPSQSQREAGEDGGDGDNLSEHYEEPLTLPKSLREDKFVESLLADAARYALAGPWNLANYREREQAIVKAGRRPVSADSMSVFAYPLVQKIYVDWLRNAQRREADQPLQSKRFHERALRKTAAYEEASAADARLANQQFERLLTARKATFTALTLEKQLVEAASQIGDVEKTEFQLFLTVKSVIELLEDHLDAAEKAADPRSKERAFLTWARQRRPR